MSDRVYRILIGVLILLALFFTWPMVIYAIIVMATLEGLTNFRLPIVVNKLFKIDIPRPACDSYKYKFEAERALRIMMASFLVVSYLALPDVLWLLPWFIGFAMFGAGLSGICPSLSFLKWAGFR